MTTLDDFIRWNEEKWEDKNVKMYETENANAWPWFSSEIDLDILNYIKNNDIKTGNVLDLGTCSGSQAIALANMGFNVLGTDVSETALTKAKSFLPSMSKGTKLEFIYDDVLHSKLESGQYDIIIDRGCFHSICCISTKKYLEQLERLLSDKGVLLLKTMSLKEEVYISYDVFAGKQVPMPYRFDEDILRQIFSERFNIQSIEDSVFYSTVIDPPAKAMFCVISKK